MRVVVCGVMLAAAVVGCMPQTKDAKPPRDDRAPTMAVGATRDSVREGFIQVPGGKVWYRIVGANKPGIPLLTLHGGPGMPSYYLSPLSELADERPVIFFDQLGCGRSDRPDDPTLWTIPRFVQEVQAVREALGYKEVHILGHSWGTLLAFEYLLTKPTGVRSVIMSGPAISIVRFRHDVDSMIAMMPDSMIRAIRENEKAGTTTAPAYMAASAVFYARHVIRTTPMPADVDSTFKYVGTQVYNTMNGPTEFTVVGTFKDYDGTPRLKEVTQPVLWMAGEFDETSPNAARDFQRMLPGSEFVQLAGAGHMTMWDARAPYLNAIREFIRRN